LQDRINSRDLLQRKHFFIEDYSCVMCNSNVLETRTHLLFQCSFAKPCWKYICPTLNIDDSDSHLVCISKLRVLIEKPFFMEIITLCSWSIWITRNSYIFNQIRPSLYRCRSIFKAELKWLKYRAHKKSYSSFSSWADNFR
jgi:hypothetical protein